MTTKSMKGFEVVTDKKGRKSLKRIFYYGRDASARIRMQKSTKTSVKHPSFAALFSPKA